MLHNFNDRAPVVLAGSASIMLAEEIARQLDIQPGIVEIRHFSDSETFVKIIDNIRGRDVFVVQSTCQPTNEHLMELLLMLDAALRASAARITAVIPYFGYARQDRKDQGRVALSAKLVANLISTAGAGRVLTIDLHSGQIQGFFDVPMDHLLAGTILVDYIKKSPEIENYCVVSPDVGNVKLARNYADLLRVPLAIVDKRRPAPNVSEVMSIIGEKEVYGKNVLIFDDMIDTAGTICNASQALRDKGARDVYALAVHGVLSGPALERLEKAPLKEVIITNTISRKRDLPEKIKVLSVAPLIAQAIERINNHKSVSDLFREMAH